MRWLGLLPLLVAGCGYVVEGDRSQERLPSGGLPAVAVVPFDNLTFRRGLEMELTRLVADEVRARSPRAPTSGDRADWLLEGKIVRADERVISEDRADSVRESSFIVTVEVTLKEQSTERILRSDSFTTREPFSTRAGRIATVEDARREALRDLAENIVYWLEAHGAKENS